MHEEQGCWKQIIDKGISSEVYLWPIWSNEEVQDLNLKMHL